MSRLDAYLTDRSDADALRADASYEVAVMLDRVRDLSGDPLWRLAEEVIGPDVLADLLVERLAGCDPHEIRAHMKRAAVRP